MPKEMASKNIEGETLKSNISRFLDEEGKIIQLPTKATPKRLVLEYLATKFSSGKHYSEKEINATIDEWHTFNDYFLLRRELIDNTFLCRTRDGSKYWKEK